MVVSKVLDTDPDVDVAKMVPSTRSVRDAIPEVVCPATAGSLAVAEVVILPETVLPLAGAVTETTGTVVSGLEKVVAEAEELWAELFPAASKAWTVKE